jgi:hypothetical protein
MLREVMKQQLADMFAEHLHKKRREILMATKIQTLALGVMTLA